MSESVFERVREALARAFKVQPGLIEMESSPETVENWDSLQHMHMVIALEREFSIHFDLEEVEQLVSVDRIVALVEKKLT